jgi:hypothetical protein
MSRQEAFNRSGIAKFLNSPAGRTYRMAAGISFIVAGIVFRYHALGVLSIVWGVLPFSAGAPDICFVSAVLGGPLSGVIIRSKYV